MTAIDGRRLMALAYADAVLGWPCAWEEERVEQRCASIGTLCHVDDNQRCDKLSYQTALRDDNAAINTAQWTVGAIARELGADSVVLPSTSNICIRPCRGASLVQSENSRSGMSMDRLTLASRSSRLDGLCSTVAESARALWACLREDHAEHMTYPERCGFSERFRSWGAHLKLDAFDPSRWTSLAERLAAAGARLVLYPDLHVDPDRDAKLMALQEALVVAVVADGSDVGRACLLGSRSDASTGCGLTGVLPA